MGTVAPPRNNPRAIEQEVMNTIFGGQFSSRVNMNLREEKHWSYGAWTFMLPARGPRPYLGGAPVQTDKTREALFEFIKEAKGIRGEKPVTAAELAAAQASLTLALPGGWETARAVGRSTAEILRFGLADRYWDGYAAAVRAVDLKAVADAAQIVDPARIVWVVVGDRARVEAGLKELGLGAPRLIDGEGRPVAAR
jgi:zinc protease